MHFHEFSEDFIFASEFGFEELDFVILGVVDGVGFSRVVGGSLSVLEKLFEPSEELRGKRIVLVAAVGNGDLFEETLFEDGDILRAIETSSLLGHVSELSFRLC